MSNNIYQFTLSAILISVYTFQCSRYTKSMFNSFTDKYLATMPSCWGKIGVKFWGKIQHCAFQQVWSPTALQLEWFQSSAAV